MELNVVAALILNNAGDVLCVRRGGGGYPSTANKWEFPGGKSEPGETPEQTAVREVREELEMDVTPLGLGPTVHHVYPEFAICLRTVLCAAAREAAPRLREHTEWCWCTPDRLALLDFAAADTAILLWLRERFFGSVLRTETVGRTCTFLRETDSTNDELLRRAEAGAPEGTLVVAESQRAGRGRLGRTWLDIPGNSLLFSLLVRPTGLPPEVAATVPLVGGVAMALAIREMTRLDVGLKWPNDLLLGDRKVCGILCEAQTSARGIEGIILGIGVNTGSVPEELAHRAVGLGGQAGRMRLLAAFCRIFEGLYARWLKGGLAALRTELDTLDCKKGHPITVRQSELIQGIARGIRDDGALLLEQPDGTVRAIHCGEINQWD